MSSKIRTKFAVLVHQLPLDCKTDALSLLPNKYIENVTHDVVGLRIYFKVYESARKCILQRTIQVRGMLYTVCPLVTNLTLHNIRKYASELTIKNAMSSLWPVIDVYVVEEVYKEGEYETKSLTDDYRVILDVPEVQADFNLSPLCLPSFTDFSFQVSFFCRLCRANGHRQYQCPRCAPGSSRREASFHQQRWPGHRKTSLRTGPPDTLTNRARYSSNQRTEKRIPVEKSKIKTLKVKKEQDSTCHIPLIKREFNENGIGNALAEDSFTFKSEPAESKGLKCDILYNQDGYATHPGRLKIKLEDSFEQQCSVSTMPGIRNISSEEVLNQRDIKIDTPIEKGEDHAVSDTFRKEDHCGSEKTYPYEKTGKKKQSKQLCRNVLRRLVPPGTSINTTKKLLRIVFRTRCAQDISPEMQFQLQELLDWNSSRDKKKLKEMDKKFIKWLEMYLAKVDRERNHGDNSDGTEKIFQPEDVTGEQPSEETSKNKSKRHRATDLSPGIEQIVLKTTGVLDPDILRNFLNQVRGRRKQLEITTYFTKDFPALFSQLENVEKNYYLYGKRGTREDRDIDFIHRLRNRLIVKCKVKEEVCMINEETCFMRQTCSDKGISTEFVSHFQKNVDCDDQSSAKSVLTKQSTSDVSSTEITKTYVPKYTSKSDNTSRISSSTAQSSIKVYSAGKCKVNLQRNLSLDVRRCRIPTSTRQSSNEDEPFGEFKRVVQQNTPVENKLSSARKRSSSGEDSPGKFQMNCSFYNVQSTSRWNDTRRPSTDGGSVGNSNRGIKKELSVRRSSYTTQSSTDEEYVERKLPFDTQTARVSSSRSQTNIEEVSSEISTIDLRKILSFVNEPHDKL